MAKYLAKRDIWISHDSRLVREGEEFETVFPTVNGQPMRLGDSLELIPDVQEGKAPARARRVQSGDDLV